MSCIMNPCDSLIATLEDKFFSGAQCGRLCTSGVALRHAPHLCLNEQVLWGAGAEHGRKRFLVHAVGDSTLPSPFPLCPASHALHAWVGLSRKDQFWSGRRGSIWEIRRDDLSGWQVGNTRIVHVSLPYCYFPGQSHVS